MKKCNIITDFKNNTMLKPNIYSVVGHINKLFILHQIQIRCSLEDQMLELHNKYRVKIKKPPFTKNELLQKEAQGHAEYQKSIHEMTHDGPPGSIDIGQRVKNAHYTGWIKIGENVAVNKGSEVKDVFRMWLESPKHKENIDDIFTEIGIASVLSESDNKRYWAVAFGAPDKMKPEEKPLKDICDNI